MASTYGTNLRVTLFGTSHGPEIGVCNRLKHFLLGKESVKIWKKQAKKVAYSAKRRYLCIANEEISSVFMENLRVINLGCVSSAG